MFIMKKKNFIIEYVSKNQKICQKDNTNFFKKLKNIYKKIIFQYFVTSSFL